MDVQTNRLIGKYLKTVRKSAGLTQRDVAERCHVAQSFVSKLEQGERSLQFFELFEYSEALGVTPEELFAGSRHVLLQTKDIRP